jgi:hypothetical protein
MNKTLFLSLSIGCLGVVASLLGAAPASAQGNNVPVTGYSTGETIQISGWETDLVRRNKGLEKFHWSAINTVQHYNVVQAGASMQKGSSPVRALSPYHNSKPQVISNWSNTKAPIACIASADNGSRTNVNAHLRHNNSSTSTYAQLNRSFDGAPGAYQSQYGFNRGEGQVSGRVMHY